MRSSAVLALVAACTPLGADDLAPPSAPAGVHEACVLTAQRCSHCHDLDRVVDAHVATPDGWRATVRRMRLQPGSDIRPDDEPPIVRCLVYHSFEEAP